MNKFKKIIFSILSVIMIFTPLHVYGFNTAETSKYETVTDILFNEDSYIEWLESLDYEGTDEVINDFLALDDEEQNLFLRILDPENYIQLLDLERHESGTFGSVEIDGEEILFAVVDESDPMLSMILDSTPIVVTMEYENTPLLLSRNAGDREFTATYQWTFLGIGITRLESTFRFRINTSTQNPTHSISVRDSHSNWNPGIIVNNFRSSHEMFSGRAYGYATWRINMTASLTFVPSL